MNDDPRAWPPEEEPPPRREFLSASVRYSGGGLTEARATIWINGQCIEGCVRLAVVPGTGRKYRMELEVEVDELVFVDRDGTTRRAVL